jgi:hypothetical protein
MTGRRRDIKYKSVAGRGPIHTGTLAGFTWSKGSKWKSANIVLTTRKERERERSWP